jgi:hypothetical protein
MELIGLIFALMMGVVCLQRACRVWRNRRKKDRGRYRGGAALGNALQALQVITQPHAKHVIEARLDEAADEEDEETPRDPKAHLLRQAKRIRKGEEIDRLTALLPP